MPREIVVNFEGEVSRFGLERLTREKLYGRKRRVVVDQLEQECTTAMLTRDGDALVAQGAVAHLYVDDDFDVVERAALQAVDENVEPVPEVASTLDREQPLHGPVPMQRVLDQITTAVYALTSRQLGATLREGLGRGDVYETQFAYRSGYDAWPAFLVQNDAGIFALVGRFTDFDYLGRERRPSEDEDDDSFEDELDFRMM